MDRRRNLTDPGHGRHFVANSNSTIDQQPSQYHFFNPPAHGNYPEKRQRYSSGYMEQQYWPPPYRDGYQPQSSVPQYQNWNNMVGNSSAMPPPPPPRFFNRFESNGVSNGRQQGRANGLERPESMRIGKRGERKERWMARNGNDERQQKTRSAQSSGANRGNNKAKQYHLPDRWDIDPVGIGRQLANTRFLPFKCPLRPEFFRTRGPHQVQPFEVGTIVNHVSTLNGQLGLVIDLTATDRYYDCQLWAHHEIQYEKQPCHGTSLDTKEYCYTRFEVAVKRFLTENADNDKLIGVHCTHGLNRTGYLICRFLVQEEGWLAKRAIQCFAEARGHPIERKPYIDTLHRIERVQLGKFVDDNMKGKGMAAEKEGEEEILVLVDEVVEGANAIGGKEGEGVAVVIE